MIITRETDYAIRILRSLSDMEKHTIPELCERDAIPKQFAYKIISRLGRSGIVKNTRGNGGGCALSYDLKTLTLWDLLSIMGDDCKINACMVPGHNCTWESNCGEACRVRARLGVIQKSLECELSKYSIYFLINGES